MNNKKNKQNKKVTKELRQMKREKGYEKEMKVVSMNVDWRKNSGFDVSTRLITVVNKTS